MVYCLSSVITGDILELDCTKRAFRNETYQVPAPETRVQSMIRRLLQRPQPMQSKTWRIWDSNRVGKKLWVVGTDAGLVVMHSEAKARALASQYREAPDAD